MNELRQARGSKAMTVFAATFGLVLIVCGGVDQDHLVC